MKRSWFLITVAATLASLTLAPLQSRSQPGTRPKIPVIVDSDIGGDIDDAFALAMLLQSKDVDLKAVTTVSADTAARARIAARMLSVAGRPSVPVAAGVPTPGTPFAQAKWAQSFSSPALVPESGVDLLHATLGAGHGRTVLIALGPLTNVAALLKAHPEDRRQIKQIVLMGGSIQRGYQPNSGPTPEYNIAADAAAAQVVFSSGIPLLVAPLDVTAATQLNTPEREHIFQQHTPLTDALHDLYVLWGQPTPTLHDPMAVALLLHPGICTLQPLHVDVTSDGMTKAKPASAANAQVAMQTDPAAFIHYYETLFTQR